ncbi:GntR family transcriptional regulator [Yoonia sediminilitoris]|uniref:GntR family transcriptional regulator n=1 Tax=Yoonia sediminilitoris TaxID=1286148 RepID=A0A2T6KIU0_9RHOB|nr:GntR family transcriptional regulator [Yoonia sediminilitoris]PUB15640.1 GntR family transcriptional regulator [Yoonia sediminilitoris]RCW96249.1 GntR family transcriptional regulator [Yoonia sediminilitoris]
MAALDIAPIETPQVSATDRVFDTLYDAVVSVALPPGTKVSEGEIAKQLGVSRQPVRDAFFRLANLGFIAIRPQRATLITRISLGKVNDAVFTRTALETECLRTAMSNSGKALLAALQSTLQQQQDAIGAETARFHTLDERFHEIICDVAGHAHIWTLIKEQKAHLDRIRFLSLSKERRQIVCDEHQSIVCAIKRDDAGAAEAALRDHIQGVQAIVERVRADFPSYFENA